IANRPYNKAEHNRALQDLTGRNYASIEFKHCNVSAVLDLLGMPTIRGYRPRPNFQNALIDGVDRYLAAKGEPSFVSAVPLLAAVAESPALWVGPAPDTTLVENDPPARMRQLIRKFDPAERDARNRNLGKRGEELVYLHEQLKLRTADRDDLARKVEWTSEVKGDGAGYDIRSFEPNGSERLIEVKTTNGPAKTPFFLSENERAFSDERADAFRLLRLYAFIEKPCAFELRPPLSERLALNPVSYRATLV
ncbi:MAG TPA: DUF3883 domain-containing protein, partial [Sphingomicrobium sp.]|nr:DUF3883 domain-containing protein [Sphingomicrobium sp.]